MLQMLLSEDNNIGRIGRFNLRMMLRVFSYWKVILLLGDFVQI